MYLFIQGSTRVTLDENGFLHAAYKNNAVYMQDQDGLSDIPMILTETDISDTENRYLAHAVLMNYTDNWNPRRRKYRSSSATNIPMVSSVVRFLWIMTMRNCRVPASS